MVVEAEVVGLRIADASDGAVVILVVLVSQELRLKTRQAARFSASTSTLT